MEVLCSAYGSEYPSSSGQMDKLLHHYHVKQDLSFTSQLKNNCFSTLDTYIPFWNSLNIKYIIFSPPRSVILSK